MKDELQPPAPPPSVPALTSHNLVAAERALCESALAHCGGSLIKAGAMLGLTRHALKRRIVKLGVKYTPMTPEQRQSSVRPLDVRAAGSAPAVV